MQHVRIAWAKWITLAVVSALHGPSSAVAQAPTAIETKLQALSSPDPDVRGSAFYALIGPLNDYDAGGAVARLLKANPGQTDEIKVTLFAALERESAYSISVLDRDQQLSEGFGNYFYDLGRAVGSMRDPRALKALLAAQDTGLGIDSGFIADLCPAAVDAAIEASHQPTHYWRGIDQHDRAWGILDLGQCLTRVAAMRSSPDAVAKARAALLAALDDPDPNVRQDAVLGLFPLRNDPEVRTRLALVAGADPYLAPPWPGESQGKFAIREAADRTLRPPNGDKSFNVMRTADSHSCKVQEAGEPSVGEQFLGPYLKADDAKRSMCSHSDSTAQNPSLCWRMDPPNACISGGGAPK